MGRKKQNKTQSVPVVLLVEDDPDIRDLVAHRLTQCGFEVLTAGDAVSAIMICRVHAAAIDVLLTDLGQPGVSGRELTRSVIALRRR